MPELPEFAHLAHGIAIDCIGEDGAVVAHGHIDPAKFLAARNLMAQMTGVIEPFTAREAADVVAEVEHRWAVNDPEMAELEVCDWWLELGGEITAETPGAFPVTYLDAM